MLINGLRDLMIFIGYNIVVHVNLDINEKYFS